jgi:hypothetical protein
MLVVVLRLLMVSWVVNVVEVVGGRLLLVVVTTWRDVRVVLGVVVVAVRL